MPNADSADYHIKEALRSIELALPNAKGPVRWQLEKAIERLARAQFELKDRPKEKQ